jgi:hypothetical protein
MADDGPLWYRGLAQESGEAVESLVNQILNTQGVKHIVIGHTPTPGAVMPRLNGKVIMIDVGLSAYFGSKRAFLVQDHDVFSAVHRGVRMPLPMNGGTAMLDYLKKASALEPAGSTLVVYTAQQEAAVGAGK